MRVIIFVLGVLIVGCSGGNQATESGGGTSQSVKYTYSTPAQDVKVDQSAGSTVVASGTTQTGHVPKRKEERSKRYLPPYPVPY
jgi:hypothetical protein